MREIRKDIRPGDDARQRCPLPEISVLGARNQSQFQVQIFPGLLGTVILCVITKGYEQKEGKWASDCCDGFQGHRQRLPSRQKASVLRPSRKALLGTLFSR